MDGSTDRCPQCGAAIRPSARYCVTCGVKLPETAASAYPPAASGWAARDESSEAADPNPGSTTAWAMPAVHADDDQADSVDLGEPEAASTPSTSADARLPEPDDADSQTASELSRSVEVVEPVIQPENDTPIMSEEGDESGFAEETSETVVVIDSAESDAAIPESDMPITEDREAMHGDDPESAVPEPEIEAIVIEENELPVTPEVEDNDGANEAISTEELAVDADPSTEQPEDANPSPLEEAAFEEILPYAAEAGSEWEPTAEPDEIFALDEIEFDDSSDFESEVLIASNDTQPAGGDVAIAETGTEAMQRANQLIDELRGLLPALTTPPQTVQSPDYSALREQAIAARGDVSFDQFAALREVVQEALSRPRDVEVVLRLSRRVEDMNALLGERDRLQQAFEQLITQLDANGAS